MRRLLLSRPSWSIFVIILVAGPAAVLMPQEIRLIVVAAGFGGWLIGWLTLRFLTSRLVTDPGWRRPRTVGWFNLKPPRREYVVPTELPPPPGVLFGRDSLVRQISDYLVAAKAAPVVVLRGPIGVGKSVLALAVGHAVIGHYRDGQVMARLDRVANTSTDIHGVVRVFVKALQGPGDQEPVDDAGAVRRYHRLTRGRRILVLLDAAASADQVLALRPQGTGCATIVTTRGNWAADESWLDLRVEELSDDSALQVLHAVLRFDETETEMTAAQRLVAAAAGNPFALQVVSTALAARRNWTLSAAVDRMDEVALDPSHPAAAGLSAYTRAFDISFSLLTEQERRAFALLGRVKESTFAPWVLSALMLGAETGGAETGGESIDSDATAERILERLTYARLVERRVGEAMGAPRFAVSEQIRPYARARASVDIEALARRQADLSLARARERHAQPSAAALRRHVYRLLHNGEFAVAIDIARGAIAGCEEQMETAQSAEERASLSEALGSAYAAVAEVNAELGWMEEAARYASDALATNTLGCRSRAKRCLALVDRHRNRLRDAERQLRDAMDAAKQLGETAETIRALRDLSVVLALQNRVAEAQSTVDRALAMCTPTNQAERRRPGVLLAKGTVLVAAERLEEAELALAEADALCGEKALGQPRWLPWIRYRRALVALAEGRSLRSHELAQLASDGFRDMFHRYGIAHCRLVIGRAYLTEENLPAARATLEDAVETFGGCGDLWMEAYAFTWLAEAYLAAQRMDLAVDVLLQAKQHFGDVGDKGRREEVGRRLVAVDRMRRTAEVAGGLAAGTLTNAPARG